MKKVIRTLPRMVLHALLPLVAACADTAGDDPEQPDEIEAPEAPYWRGTWTVDARTLGVTTPRGTCTAVAITRNHVLTAGDCLPPNNTGCAGVACSLGTVTFNVATGPGTFDTTPPLNATFFRHEGFANSPHDHNIGVIAFAGFDAPSQTSLAEITPAVKDRLFAAPAWGSTIASANSPGPQNESPSGSFVVDSTNGKFFSDDTNDGVNRCRGDEGAPALFGGSFGCDAVSGLCLPTRIAGIAGMYDAKKNRHCSQERGMKQRYTAVAPKIAWIEERLMASGYGCPAGGAPCCRHVPYEQGQTGVECW